MACILDEYEPYWCEADWNCKDCPNWMERGRVMTNGEKLKEIFPYLESDKTDLVKVLNIDNLKSWWNSEYKEPTTKNDCETCIHNKGVLECDMYGCKYEPTTKNYLEIDAVSRKAVINLATTIQTDDYSGNEIMEVVDINDVKALPSVTPQEPRWIPVSERLPKELEPVNVTWINHNPESYYADIKDKPFTATGVYFNGQWYWWSTLCTDILAEYSHNYDDIIDDDIEITAWMPLPKPYREVKE